MSVLYENNALAIGNTPLVKLNRVVSENSRVFAKIEGRNPSYSVKDRTGAALIADAEMRGLLHSGMTIVEPTSGNTGIALAFVAAVKGYALILTMPETMSIERRKVLAMLGAKLILTPGAEGMAGAIRAAESMYEADPDKYFLPQQFTNPANPKIHELTTGPEIWNATNGEVDIVIAGVGTGGTISGIGRFLKKTQNKNVHMIAIEPESSPVITQHLAGKPLQPAPHKIQGIGAGFIPATLDLDVVDQVETVSDEEAFVFAQRLAKEEGILAGISSGAATAVAHRIAKDPQFANKTIVTILPDLSERYLSSGLYAGLAED